MSWKTTLFGAIGAIATYFADQPGALHTIGVVLNALALAGLGWAARDNNKTSEDVAAAKAK